MNEQSNMPMSDNSSSPASAAGWFSIWVKAVTKPSEQTFADLAASPDAKATTAYIWVFIGTLINGFLSLLVQGAMVSSMFGDTGGGGFATTAITVICGAPIVAIIGVIGFAIATAIIQWIAKMFGGQGSFDKLAYALAAISVPLAFVNGVLTLLSAIPFVGACFGIISLGVVLYALYLNIAAVKGVNGFGWGQAAGSVLIPGIVIGCCLGLGSIAILRMLGPAIGEMFESINQSLP